MKTSRAQALLFGLGAVLVAGFLSVAEQTPPAAPAEPLPDAATAALAKAFPNAAVEKHERRKEAGDWVYDVSLKSADKRQILTEISPEGIISNINEEIPATELPETVRRALGALYPEADIQGLRVLIKLDAVYKVDIGVGQGKRRVKINPKGKILEIEKQGY